LEWYSYSEADPMWHVQVGEDTALILRRFDPGARIGALDRLARSSGQIIGDQTRRASARALGSFALVRLAASW
ncbi:MAG: hypothetical protein ACRDRA_08495, partial [Pseudonocardiaceae bacterium]